MSMYATEESGWDLHDYPEFEELSPAAQFDIELELRGMADKAAAFAEVMHDYRAELAAEEARDRENDRRYRANAEERCPF